MATVCPTLTVTIMCDCPYAGKTREITAEPERDARKRLRKELKQTREELVVAKNVLVNTRGKRATFQRLLCLELGWVVNPDLKTTQSTWKDRVREESYLKSELIHLVDYLRGCDPVYRSDPSVHPTKLSASAEDLLSLVQERTLKKLYHDYTTYRSEDEKRAGTAFWEFLELKQNYENKLYHNKVMEHEIVRLKGEIAALQRQFLEDKCLIDYITEHHFQMKGCFLEVLPKRSVSVDEDSKKENVLMDSEAEKFKQLWEESRREKRGLLTTIQTLSGELDSVDQRIVKVEKVCEGNRVTFNILTRKKKECVLLSKLRPRTTEKSGKYSVDHYRSQASQLETAVNENRYLRNFLRKAVLSKAGDLKRFQESLVSTAERYRVTLEGIRNSSVGSGVQQIETLRAPK